MDIEQLKLILETVNSAGEGAFIIAVLWISLQVFIPVIISMTIIFIATKIIKLVSRCIRDDEMAKEKKQFLRELSIILGRNTNVYYFKSELDEILLSVKQLKGE